MDNVYFYIGVIVFWVGLITSGVILISFILNLIEQFLNYQMYKRTWFGQLIELIIVWFNLKILKHYKKFKKHEWEQKYKSIKKFYIKEKSKKYIFKNQINGLIIFIIKKYRAERKKW